MYRDKNLSFYYHLIKPSEAAAGCIYSATVHVHLCITTTSGGLLMFSHVLLHYLGVLAQSLVS